MVTDSNMIAQVREGMQAHTADGKVLGKITGVSRYDTETYLEVTPAPWLMVWRYRDHTECMYLPGSAVTSVSSTGVMLNLQAKTARELKLRPNWFRGPKTSNLQYW